MYHVYGDKSNTIFGVDRTLSLGACFVALTVKHTYCVYIKFLSYLENKRIWYKHINKLKTWVRLLFNINQQ